MNIDRYRHRKENRKRTKFRKRIYSTENSTDKGNGYNQRTAQTKEMDITREQYRQRQRITREYSTDKVKGCKLRTVQTKEMDITREQYRQRKWI